MDKYYFILTSQCYFTYLINDNSVERQPLSTERDHSSTLCTVLPPHYSPLYPHRIHKSSTHYSTICRSLRGSAKQSRKSEYEILDCFAEPRNDRRGKLTSKAQLKQCSYLFNFLHKQCICFDVVLHFVTRVNDCCVIAST